MERKQFKTEVSELLHLIIHSLYSHKEIFLRELISNASDALDKLKYKTLVEGNAPEGELRIDLSFTEGDKRTLTISDNGIGMSHDELNEDLGTIARSGTKHFISSLTDEQKKIAILLDSLVLVSILHSWLQTKLKLPQRPLVVIKLTSGLAMGRKNTQLKRRNEILAEQPLFFILMMKAKNMQIAGNLKI